MPQRPLHRERLSGSRYSVCWLTLCAMALCSGCQQAPQNNTNSPWQTSSAPPPATPTPNELAQLLERQAQTSQLSQQQQDQLNRLTAMLRQQQQTELAERQQAQEDRLRQLQEQSLLVQQQKLELEQLEEVRRRALELDSNNRDLHAQLAQSQQQNRLLEDQMGMLRQQLDDAATRLSQAVEARRQASQQLAQMDQRFESMNASLQKRSGATIRANSSPRTNLEAIEIAGLTVRQDGDVVRIELPTDQVFAAGSASIVADGQPLLDQVAVALGQHYPRQMIGIEAHADNQPVDTNVWRSSHQLTAAQAMAIFDYLVANHRFGDRQMFVLGHGPNHPIASNGTPAGQQRNRRVEIVVYPETIDER